LVKAKMHALFGIAILRQVDDDEGNLGGASGSEYETDGAEEQTNDSHLDIDPRQVNMLDLNPGDDVKIMESSTPSSEFVEGTSLFLRLAMLALDIPFTFFDSQRSSFSAQIADLNRYEVACGWKRDKNRYVRQDYSNWLIANAWTGPWNIQSVAGGAKLRDVQDAVKWVPNGAPWLDKLKQVKGDKEAISIGIDNPIDAARRRGSDVFKNIDALAKVKKYAKSKDVDLYFAVESDASIIDEEPEKDE